MRKEEKPKYRQLVAEIIDKSNTVFDEIGRDFPQNSKNIILEGLGYTSFHIVEAIVLLIDKGFNQEAVILLRSLIENTVNLKWILNKNTEERIGSYFQDISKKGFGNTWADLNLKDRMLEVGFPEVYYDKVVKVAHSFSHTNAESQDWSNIEKDDSLFSSEATLAVACQMLGHVIQVFERNISPKFDFAKEIFSNIPGRAI